MSNTSLDLIEFNTSLSQQTPSEDTTLATFHHQPPPTPLPQKHNTPPQCKDVSEDNDEEGIPLTAAGLTRAMETNQGQSLTEIINISIANPSHLFWVPASQHPELAPTEFEKYVVALRANAKDKGKVKRRRSVLSQSFTAADSEMRNERNTSTSAFDEQQDGNDDDDDDDDLRNSNSKEGERQFALGALENKHHQYNISLGRSNSLQSLNEIDDNNQHDLSGTNRQSTGKKDENQSQANKHATKARKERLRRSMSLHLPGNTDTGRIPDFLVFDRNSTALDQSPVLVPKTDRPLSRRGARTRFQRTSSIAPSTPKLNNSPPERQWPAYRHSDSIYTSSSSPPLAPTTPVNDNNDNSSKDNDSDNKVTNKYHSSSDLETKLQAQSDQSNQLLHLSDNPIVFEEPQSTLDIITPPTVHPSQQPTINNPQRTIGSLSRTESPNLDHDLSTTPHKLPSTSNINQRTPSEKSSTQQVAVKSPPRERKSSWSWSFWSDDKKSKAEQPLSTATPTASSIPISMSQTNHDVRQTKHDDGHNKTENIPLPMVTSASTPTSKQRFGFSSLFSRKSSSTTNASSSPSGSNGGKMANGDNSTTSAVLTVPPKDFQLNRINHQHRLPIHVERAVYRLSHMKLANPRRPLHDQVIISNFMFWYLSLISEQQNQSQHQSTPSVPQQHNSKNGHASSRHSPPRTPQQIVSASKNKKKRLTKKSSNQNTVPPVPTLSSSASTSSSSVSSHQSKYSSSISQKASSYEQHQQHHPLSSSPPSQQHHTQDKSWQHYIDGSSKQASTGFVIPENYLRPTSESNVSDNNGTNNKSDVGKQHQRQVRQYVRRNSSSSEDDDDEDDDDDDDDEYDDDDDYDNNYKDKNSKSFYTGSKSKHQKEKTAKQMSKHMKKQHYPTGQHHHHQHQPQQRLPSPILQSAPSSS